MNDDFFDWLSECPTQWIMIKNDDDSRTYEFYNNDEDNKDE